MYELNVDPAAVEAAAEGLTKLGRQLHNIGGLQVEIDDSNSTLPNDPTNRDWVDPDFMNDAPAWADGSLNAYVTDRRLGRYALHGRALLGRGLVIVSTYVSPEHPTVNQVTPAMVRAVIKHEAGHAFGLVAKTAPNNVDGTDGHCGNECLMQRGDIRNLHGLTDMVIQDIGNPRTSGFCDDCRVHLGGISDPSGLLQH